MSNSPSGTRYGTVYTYDCAQCGTACTSHKKTARYCGSRCVNLARYDRIGRVPPKPRTPRELKPRSTRVYILDCSICDTTFVTMHTAQHTCPSTLCKATARQRRMQAKSSRRRARMKDAFVEDVHPHIVFARDGYRCHICGKKVNRKAAVPHPLAPTIDHLVPLALGGTHEPLNARTAHFICNAMKREVGSGDQLLLIA